MPRTTQPSPRSMKMNSFEIRVGRSIGSSEEAIRAACDSLLIATADHQIAHASISTIARVSSDGEVMSRDKDDESSFMSGRSPRRGPRVDESALRRRRCRLAGTPLSRDPWTCNPRLRGNPYLGSLVVVGKAVRVRPWRARTGRLMSRQSGTASNLATGSARCSGVPSEGCRANGCHCQV